MNSEGFCVLLNDDPTNQVAVRMIGTGRPECLGRV